MSFIRKSLSFTIFGLSVAPLGAGEKRPVTFEDILSIRAASDPTVSLDGSAYYHRLGRTRRQYEWISRHTLNPAAGALPTLN